MLRLKAIGGDILYCIKCGVELAEGEKLCPLCDTKVYHPDIALPSGEKSYPVSEVPVYETINVKGVLFLISIAFLIPIIITTMCDMALNGFVSWSGYVTGGLLVFYTSFVLPAWFKRPNPVIFVPLNFALVILFLLYISLSTGGGWFLSFAFPVSGAVTLLVTTVVVLCKYLKKGRLYVFGGSIIALGGIAVLIEFLISVTFGVKDSFPWSLYPLIGLFLVGMALIVIAICKPLRRSLRKKFFI